MSYRMIAVEHRGPVAWVTLLRADALNALTVEMCDELADAFGRLDADEAVRVIVITGSGRAFCAGADLKNMLAGLAGEATGRSERIAAFVDGIADGVERIREVGKPVIAAVNGITMAGGLEIAMACDIVVAAREARIGDGHANFGVFPGAGSAAVLPRRVGPHFAKLMLFSGEPMSADECLAMGLVQRVVPGDALQAEVQRLAEKIAEKSPLLLRRMKRTVADALDQPEAAALRLERTVFHVHKQAQDFEAGLAAFSERRKPVFTGR
jgi:enoyl-CoA hydratase/carnithine racemase